MRIFFLILFCCLSFSVLDAHAEEMYGKVFAHEKKVAEISFVLQGLGVKTYLMVKVFVAGFYLGEGAGAKKAENDVPKQIEVAYFYPIPGRKLAVETRRRMVMNTSKEDFARIKDRVDAMDKYFVDLKPGDRYALTYIPGTGTIFSLNDQPAGTIEGFDFAQALFAVWIGPKPLSEDLKSRLLGQE